LSQSPTIYPKLKKNYQGHDCELINKAVSNKKGDLYLHLFSRDLSQTITHSQITANPCPTSEEDLFLLRTDRIIVTTLDDEITPYTKANLHNLLVKVDVDGEDATVMEGMASIAPHTAMLIVECPTHKLNERFLVADLLGFDIFDITSPGYYYNQLSQVDVFFVNRVLKANLQSLNPWRAAEGKLDWNQWIHFS
jgi:FkbM family methyltransferase